jgi:hypothetical protein
MCSRLLQRWLEAPEFKIQFKKIFAPSSLNADSKDNPGLFALTMQSKQQALRFLRLAMCLRALRRFIVLTDDRPLAPLD